MKFWAHAASTSVVEVTRSEESSNVREATELVVLKRKGIVREET